MRGVHLCACDQQVSSWKLNSSSITTNNVTSALLVSSLSVHKRSKTIESAENSMQLVIACCCDTTYLFVIAEVCHQWH